MKICMLVHNPPFQGGIVQYCILLANTLYKKGIDLEICGFKKLYPPLLYKGKLPKENKSGLRFEMPSYNFITWYNPLTWVKVYLKLKKSDILHFHWVSPLLAPLQYSILKLNKLFSKKKVVVTCHNIEPHEKTIFDKIFTKIVFSNIDHFIVHAKQNYDRLIKYYKIPKEKISMIPHGNFNFFKEWSNKTKKEDFGLKNKKIILFFGYIREYKGLRFLLRALPAVIKENNNVILVIAGELWQKWEIYKKEINKFNLSKNIKTYLYFIPDQEVHKFFEIADIVVLPYYNTEQTISGPLLVSLAFNKPIIISPIGGIPELVKDKQDVLFSQSGNVTELSKNINKLLDNKKLQQILIKNSKKIKTIHDWDIIAQNHIEVYKRLK